MFARDNQAYKWLQTHFFLSLTLIASLLAICLILAKPFLPHGLAEIMGHLATAVITAVILGLSLDWVFHQRLIEDVFKASIGYILPDELKGEVQALYEAPFVCVEYIQNSEILGVSNRPDLVQLHTTITRKFKNVTSRRRELPVTLRMIESLNHPELQSRILDIGCSLGDQSFTKRSPISLEAGINAFTQTLEDRVFVAPGQTGTVWYETLETKRSTDVAHFMFEHPTREPLVNFRLRAGPGYLGNVRFNSRHYANRDMLGNTTYRMRETLNPFQSIELRWFREADVVAWQDQLGTAQSKNQELAEELGIPTGQGGEDGAARERDPRP